MNTAHSSNLVKRNLKDLSDAIHIYLQALDNAVSEIEFLEKQNEKLKYEIQYAFTFPDGSHMTLEELAQEYWTLRKQIGKW